MTGVMLNDLVLKLKKLMCSQYILKRFATFRQSFALLEAESTMRIRKYANVAARDRLKSLKLVRHQSRVDKKIIS